MNWDEVQSTAASQLAAVTALAALPAPITFSYDLDDETVKNQINAALHGAGVALEIGDVEYTEGTGTQGRFGTLMAHFDISAAENPKVTHSPSGMALVVAIVRAITHRISTHEIAPICTGKKTARSEQGYILHEISFSVPVVVR